MDLSEIQQEVVALTNEYRRLDRQLASKEAQLSALLSVNGEAGPFPTDFDGVLNRRYSIDVVFDTPPDASVLNDYLQPKELPVIVDAGTIFRCAAIETFVTAIGTGVDPYSGNDTTVQATLAWDARLNYFDFLSRIRDTGTDREWFDRPQPSLFLGGGYTGPLWLPRRVILGGGTVIYASIEPFRNIRTVSALSGGFFVGGSVSQYVVQVSFIGHQVPDNSEL